MIADALRKLVEELDGRIRERELGQPFFPRNEYESFPLKREGFRPLSQEGEDKRTAFIDGGNLEILGAPNFSIQLNRVYFNIFKGKERAQPKALPNRTEFFSATLSDCREGEIFYNTSVYPVSDEFKDLLPMESDLSFSSTDRSVMVGKFRADIQRVASIARRFAEWEYSRHIIESELEDGDLLVMDGTLQTAFTNESKYSNSAYNAAKKGSVIFSGLSKTSGLFTTTGLSLMGAIQKLAEVHEVPHAAWCYPVAEAVAEDHQAAIYVVKLNPQAERIFRYEILKEQADQLKGDGVVRIIGRLLPNSCDISFPGYPYGLLDADLKARVRMREVEVYKMKLLSEISKREGLWDEIVRHALAVDAHDILNTLAG